MTKFNLQDVFMSAGKFGRKHGSAICSIVAGVGVIGTAVVSEKAGEKIHEIKNDETLSEEQKKKEIFKAWCGPFAVVTGTVACITGSYILDQRKQAGMAAAINLMTTRYNTLHEKIKEKDAELAEEIDKEIIEESATKGEMAKDNSKPELLKEFLGSEVIMTEIHRGTPILCYDAISELFFYSSQEDILEAKYQINRFLKINDEICVNDYLMFFGLPEQDWGWELGWSISSDNRNKEESFGYEWLDFWIDEEYKIKDTTVCKISVAFDPYSIYDGNAGRIYSKQR